MKQCLYYDTCTQYVYAIQMYAVDVLE